VPSLGPRLRLIGPGLVDSPTLETPTGVESTPDPELNACNHYKITSAALPFDNSFIWCQYFDRKG